MKTFCFKKLPRFLVFLPRLPICLQSSSPRLPILCFPRSLGLALLLCFFLSPPLFADPLAMMYGSSSPNGPPQRNTSSPSPESRTTFPSVRRVQPSPELVSDSAYTNTGFYPIRSSFVVPSPPPSALQHPLPSVQVSPPPASTPLNLPLSSSSDAATMR